MFTQITYYPNKWLLQKTIIKITKTKIINYKTKINKNYKKIIMLGIVKNLASNLFFKNTYKFSAGYFSHRTTSDNNDSTPFDFTD